MRSLDIRFRESGAPNARQWIVVERHKVGGETEIAPAWKTKRAAKFFREALRADHDPR